jgi:hypothetical protein
MFGHGKLLTPPRSGAVLDFNIGLRRRQVKVAERSMPASVLTGTRSFRV